MTKQRKLAVVTGASTGIGYYIAKECAEHGCDCDLLIAVELRATEAEFFERADMLDTMVGTKKKQDPREVAEAGFDAMMDGKGDVATGWQNVLRSAIANITPAGMLAEQHRAMAEPGSARR